MRLLKRNLQPFTVYPFTSTEYHYDSDGNYTGEKTRVQADGVEYLGNISAPTGLDYFERHGVAIRYDRVILTYKDVVIDEHSIVGIDGKKFVVRRVAPSLNHLTILCEQTDD